ncbi:KH domain-containing protein 3 [Lemmus lemmus]
MVPFKTYKLLVQLQHKEVTLFEVVGDSSMLPEWFSTEYLDDPKTVYVNAWLVEAIFGKDGEYISHVESTSRTLLQVTQWNPEEDAEILIFGPPFYQDDVSKMISNLVNYFSRRMVTEAGNQEARVAEAEAATQQAPMEVSDAATQLVPVTVSEAATQQAHVEANEAATEHTSGAVHQDVVQEAATQQQLCRVL